MNMGLKKLQERVKKQQEKVGKKVTVDHETSYCLFNFHRSNIIIIIITI